MNIEKWFNFKKIIIMCLVILFVIIIFTFLSFKTSMINYWLIAILLLMLICFIIVFSFLFKSYLFYKKNYLHLKTSKNTGYGAQITKLKNKIASYERIYPDLKNFEHGQKYNYDYKNNLGIIGELVVKKVLKTICEQKKLQLFNNLYLQVCDNKVNQIDHLLIAGNCIFVIETKNWLINTYGDYTKKNWIQYRANKKEFIKSPIYQNKSHVKTIYAVLKSENFNLAQIKVFNIVVFVKNNLKINSNNEFNSNVKALNLIDLYRYIEEKLKKYETTDFSSKYYENNITRIILKNNKYENIKNHKQQLSY